MDAVMDLPEAHPARIDRLLRLAHGLFWLAPALVFTLLIQLAPLGYDVLQAGVGVRRRLRELYPGRHELTLVEHERLVRARLALWSGSA